MIPIFPSAFFLGVREELEKFANVGLDSMPINENILPTITNQARWKYVRTKDGLKLTDGNLVYSFRGLPEEYPGEDLKVERAADDNILGLDEGAVSKGTAQIHRSSPDNVYVTLADGRINPTFMLQHEGGSSWRYSPSKKFVQKLKALTTTHTPESPVVVDQAALFDGARDTIKQAVYNPLTRTGGMDASEAAKFLSDKVNQIGDIAGSTSSWMYEHPIISLLGGYGIVRGVGALRDKLNPQRVVERESDPLGESKRQTSAIAAASLPLLASGMWLAK